MDFLYKNYEKLILVVCLLGLLLGVVMVTSSMKNTKETIAQAARTAKQDVTKGEDLTFDKGLDNSIDTYFKDNRKQLVVCPVVTPYQWTPKASLLVPPPLVMCSNWSCHKLLSINSAVCPFCSTRMPDMTKEPTMEDDTDEDGIPDLVEQDIDGLNWRNPYDADMDFDGDGFTNLEEYLAKTDMLDAAEIPPLAVLLRTANVKRPNLLFKISDVEKNRSEDKNQWEISLKYTDPNAANARENRVTAKFGETYGGYKITDVAWEGEGRNALPYIIITAEDDPEEEYRVDTETRALASKKLMGTFYFLVTKDPTNIAYVFRRQIRVRTGKTFDLPWSKEGETYTETYRLLSADE